MGRAHSTLDPRFGQKVAGSNSLQCLTGANRDLMCGPHCSPLFYHAIRAEPKCSRGTIREAILQLERVPAALFKCPFHD